MRITSNGMARQMLIDIANAGDRLSRQQRQVSTAKRINLPSDDPVGASLAMALRDSLLRLAQAQRNGDEAESRLQASSDLLSSVQLALEDAKNLALSGSSDSLSPSERQNLAEDVNQKLEHILAQANGRSVDGYLFGGTQTTVAPFTATRDVNGFITAVSANPLGIDGEVRVQLAGGDTIVANVPGSQVFTGSVDIFQLLIQVRDTLNTGSTSAVGATLANLDQAVDQMRRGIGNVGSRIARVRELQQGADAEAVALKARLSRIEDADLAEAAVQFQQAQTVYQASLVVASKTLQISLLDFLR